MIKKIKMPKQAGWLIPGLQVKRWFALIFVGTALMTVGILILFDLQPIYNTMQFISKIATKNFYRMACFWYCYDWCCYIF